MPHPVRTIIPQQFAALTRGAGQLEQGRGDREGEFLVIHPLLAEDDADTQVDAQMQQMVRRRETNPGGGFSKRLTGFPRDVARKKSPSRQ